MRRALVLVLLAACSGPPIPSDYRRQRIDEGVQKTVFVEGHRLCYWDKGTGPVVLLLHGLGGSNYDWRFVYEPLVAAGYRVLALEMLGVGYSDKPAGADYSIQEQARRTSLFLQKLGIEKAHIVGSSFGGGIGLGIALRSPAQVDRLILLNAAGLPQPIPFHVAFLRIPLLPEIAMELTPKTWLIRMGMKEIYFDLEKLTDEEVDEYAHELAFAGAGRCLIATARSIHPEQALDLAREYRAIAAPTLIVWGDEDEVIPVRNAKWLHDEIRGSRLLIFPRCGHCPHMEYPQETLKAILEFLKS